MEEETYILNRIIASAIAFRGVSQAELARRLGVTQQSVAKAVKRNRPLSEAAFRRYMAALGYQDHCLQQSPRGDLIVTFWAGNFGLEKNKKN